jgi:pyrrolidone-carboxylate peptidase
MIDLTEIVQGGLDPFLSPWRIELPIHSILHLQIEYSILPGTFDTNESALREKLETSNPVLILF